MKKGIGAVLSLTTGVLIGGTASAAAVFKKKQIEKEEWKNMSNKHLTLMLLLNQWLIKKQEGKSIIEYFQKKGITNIAIYGMSYLGERLLDELRESEIKVKYAIDMNANNIYTDVDVFLPSQELPRVDAVVVTAVSFFYDIQEMLSKKVDYEIISLVDLIK